MNPLDKTVCAPCPQCDRTTAQQNVYARGTVQHLRCELCRTVNPYAIPSAKLAVALLTFDRLIERCSESTARTYRSSEPFSDGDLFVHPTFGAGYVLTILSPPKKMEVMFSDKNRILVCGPGSVPAERPVDAVEKPTPRKTQRRRKQRKATTEREAPTTSNTAGPVTCPSCGATVHPYNILKTRDGLPNRCMHCSRY